MMMKNNLIFEECKNKGYKPRTVENASADVTIVFAVKFDTPGEKLTSTEVMRQGKLYIPVDLTNPTNLKQDHVDWIAERINKLNKPEVSINIAGNSITRFKWESPQENLDRIVYNFLHELDNNDIANFKISLIRSGGQSGADEAGIKAAIKLGINALVYAPCGWIYRNSEGKDIADETLFKQRFL